ncbi:CU044_5270 family protein [Asanoa siamensis]|uniref:Uncharacterized protein n=1 Tax=Asanoa siamensis TaxID=926357 RepID=A0ABQ4CQ85_9ACTN|nr:CU044_5270 family protein [Asanoa siamensis]GIF73435.1 hypothetical protein Asi02nite_29530 [Asanoa siamensis]
MTSPLSGFEERLLTELRAHVATRPAPATRWSRRRVVLTAAAVTLTGGALTVPLVGVGEQPAAASAQRVLRDAARAARREPTLTARPDQWVFTELRVVSRPDPGVDRYVARGLRRWVTAGTGDEWEQRFQDETSGEWRTVPPAPGQGRPAGYLAGLPTDPEGMLRYLRADEGSPFLTALLLLHGYLPPASRAAIFEAMADDEGVRMLPGDVVDAAGRPGVGLRLPGLIGATYDVIFDRADYAYLGNRAAQLSGGREVLDHSTARLRTTIVDRLGDVPNP